MSNSYPPFTNDEIQRAVKNYIEFDTNLLEIDFPNKTAADLQLSDLFTIVKQEYAFNIETDSREDVLGRLYAVCYDTLHSNIQDEIRDAVISYVYTIATDAENALYSLGIMKRWQARIITNAIILAAAKNDLTLKKRALRSFVGNF